MRIGVVTFTDGRKRVAEALWEDCLRFQQRLVEWLKSEGHEVVADDVVVWNWETAKKQGGRMKETNCDAVIFNFCVWSYPDFTVQCAQQFDAPILFLGNINPGYPGWVAFFASAGALDEIGRPFGRALGDIDDPKVQETIREFLRRHSPDKRQKGYEAAKKLFGLRYGEIDGPSMGMYTGHIDQSQWMWQFGIHVHHVSQLTIAARMEKISDDRVEAGLKWLEEHAAAIEWDPPYLSPGLDGTLARQIRLYLAVKDLCKEEGLDFCGLTGQLDFTEWERGVTMDLAEALLNDIADWEENPKRIIITATECDSNGALTMQLMHHLTGTPVLFADLRHYHADLDVYDLVNSGQHSPWLAKYSDDFRVNWKEVHLRPAPKLYFPCGGASVAFFSDPVEKVTFGRITRYKGRYRMHIFTGSFVRFGKEKDEELARMTTWEWPHAFARFDCPMDVIAKNFSCNHIHAVLGDWVGELVAACEYLDIEPIVLS
jgi:L-fucose isomerase and related proteins